MRGPRRIADALSRRLLGLPEDAGAVEVACRGGRRLRRGEPFTVVSWNVQFCGGRDRVFFYDGGADVSVPREDVLRNVDGIARALRAMEPDVVLLQEVDRNSRRTAHVDQHAALLRRVPFFCDLSTPYWRVRYVPTPRHERLGRVDMHLSIFSRFRVSQARRHALAPLREPWLRQQFNLRRAVLEARLPLEEGGEIALFDTHLSAFSRGDGTLPAQVGQVLERVHACGAPLLLAGDFNALPPGDDPARLPDPGEYADGATPVGRVFEALDCAIGPGGFAEVHRTYLPPGAAEPDRTLDYAFTSGLEVLEHEVVRGAEAWSDHLPLRVVARVR